MTKEWKYIAEVDYEKRDFTFKVIPDIKVEIPSKLYKYYGISYNSLEALKNCYFFASHPRHLNDPFDCYINLIDFENITKATYQKVLGFLEPTFGFPIEYLFENKRDFLKEWLIQIFWEITYSKLGILSLSSNPLSTQMWSYYTEQKGFQLTINISKLPSNFHGPLMINYTELIEQIDFSKGAFLCLLYQACNKDINWKHENEWRYLISGSNDLIVPESYFEQKNPHDRKFPYPTEAIEEITLGYKFFSRNEIKSQCNGKTIFEIKTSDCKTDINNYRREILEIICNKAINLYAIELLDNLKFECERKLIELKQLEYNVFSFEYKNKYVA